jgi:hypothetical protein
MKRLEDERFRNHSYIMWLSPCVLGGDESLFLLGCKALAKEEHE